MSETEFEQVIQDLNKWVQAVLERVQILSDNQDSYSMALGTIIDILEKNNLLPEEDKPE